MTLFLTNILYIIRSSTLRGKINTAISNIYQKAKNDFLNKWLKINLILKELKIYYYSLIIIF